MTTIANILRTACKYRALSKEQQRAFPGNKKVHQVPRIKLCIGSDTRVQLLVTSGEVNSIEQRPSDDAR